MVFWQRFLSEFRHHAATGGRSSSFLVEESIVTRRPLPRNPGGGLGADIFLLAGSKMARKNLSDWKTLENEFLVLVIVNCCGMNFFWSKGVYS